MQIYTNNDFKNKTKEEIDKWILLNKHNLAGSAIFTKGDNKISKLISFVCKGKSKHKDFVPSHVGSLILLGNNVFKFDMKPPYGTLTSLSDYILNTKEEYIIMVRNFELNTEVFSLDVCLRVNRTYGYLSAIQSAFKYMWYPFKEHCSEIHLKCLQRQELFTEYSANATTPDGLYDILIGKEKQ